MAKILLVEDSPTQVRGISRMLLRHGHDVLVAQSGEEGVDTAKMDLPDLIIMDIVMPGMNGFQATRHINQDIQTSHIPIIMLSSKGLETDKVWAARQGARDYIVKPAEELDLIQRIDALLPA